MSTWLRWSTPLSALLLLGGSGGCHVPAPSGSVRAAAAGDAAPDPQLLAEFHREEEANRASAPSYGASASAPLPAPTQAPEAVTFPFLPVTTTATSSDGRVMKLRGTVENPYDEPIEGVRYLVLVGAPTGGSNARVLERLTSESSMIIDAHSQTALKVEVSSMYFGSQGTTPVTVKAFGKKMGGRDIPIPASVEWSGN